MVNYGSASVSIISGTLVVKTVKVNPHPVAAFYDPANAKMYVTNTSTFSTITFTCSPSTVYAINSATFAVTKINLGVPASFDLLYDPANKGLNTSTSFYSSSSPEIIMISSSNIVTTVSTAAGSIPEVKGYSPKNQELYVSLGSNLIALSKTNAIAGTINGVSGVFLAAYNPISTDMYFSSFTSTTTAGTVVIVSALNSIVSSLTVGKEPTFLLYDPTNNDIYVTNVASNTTSVISSSNSLVTTIKDGRIPVLPMYNPKDGDVFVLSVPRSPATTKGSVEVLCSVSTQPNWSH